MIPDFVKAWVKKRRIPRGQYVRHLIDEDHPDPQWVVIWHYLRDDLTGWASYGVVRTFVMLDVVTRRFIRFDTLDAEEPKGNDRSILEVFPVQEMTTYYLTATELETETIRKIPVEKWKL